MTDNLKAISLFSGAGGMDLGLAQAGIETVANVEIDPNCANTLRANFTSTVFEGDIRSFSPEDVLDALGLSEIDIIHGGPPCQPFSQIGGRKGLGHKDGSLIFELVRWLEVLKPKMFIVEQVKGLVKHKAVFEGLLGSLSNLGYHLTWDILNTVDYGIAQARQRVIIIGSLSGKPSLPAIDQYQNSGTSTVGEAIKGLPSPTVEIFANHFDKTPARDRERISWVKEGEWLSKSKAPADIIMRLTKKDTTKFRRLHRDLPSLTLRCGEIFYHPIQSRYLTPREYMRIHGYPDSFVLSGPIRSRTGQVKNLDQHRQIANSVPPPLAKAIGESVIKEIQCHL